MDSVGSLHFDAGHKRGCEAAVHAVRTVFKCDDSETGLITDAANTFNSANGNVFLCNMRIIYSSLSPDAYNCYLSLARLFVIGTEIKSSQRKTHGDPAAIAIYAVSIIPMILMLLETISNISKKKTKLVTYADDLLATPGRIS